MVPRTHSEKDITWVSEAQVPSSILGESAISLFLIKTRGKVFMHPWHDVSIGDESPRIVTAIIEIPQGSRHKYEIDKSSGLLRLDRILSSSVFYPANYGFIPKTLCDDGDALDILVLGQGPALPLCLMESRVLGTLKMIDGGKEDDKIIAVHKDDPAFKHLSSFSALQQAHGHWLKEIEHFFRTYKALDNKTVEVGGILGEEEALKVVMASIELYNKKFPS